MTFSLNIKKELKSTYSNNFVNSFYLPVLKEAELYRRVSAYFSIDGLDLYEDSLEELAKNGGKVQFIISKEISKEDFQKIKRGYDLLNELKPLKLSERNERLNSKTQEQLGNLAFMIAHGRAQIKVALTNRGIFHDKFGIITSENEHIFFSGSVNETFGGMSNNYESIIVDKSWDRSEAVRDRINSNIIRFERLWNNIEDGVEVIEASELAYEEVAKYQTQSTINKSEIRLPKIEDKIPNNSIIFTFENNKVIRIDNSTLKLTDLDRKLRKGSDLTKFFEDDNRTIKDGISYIDIERVIRVTQERANRKNIQVIVQKELKDYLQQSKYSIEHYKILGAMYKGATDEYPLDKLELFSEFKRIIQEEVSRPLYDIHLKSAYYEYEMAKAANFSVPGAGKTAMLLGVFAYLNSKWVNKNEQIDRMLVIAPINAFESWKNEFKLVFGNKKKLSVIDSQSSSDFKYELLTKWKISNLILINYESLPSYSDLIKDLIDIQTMLIFDEVHRIKNPDGIRAKSALAISQVPKFKYVMTGTPIPNTYKDIYNFLHILYGNEYNSFFGWNLEELDEPKRKVINEINSKIFPFFWRTNKDDLNVPKPENDNILLIAPSIEQLELAEAIYKNEHSSLARMIRLIQASTNPKLVTQAINYSELMSYDEDQDGVKGISKEEFDDLLQTGRNYESGGNYSNFDFSKIETPKFNKGIELICDLSKEGKKVLVWGIFVDTIKKITKTLQDKGIKVNLIYGGTNKDERVNLINEFRDGDVQVLVSNPQTLGESVSLHQTVHDAVYFEYDFNLTFMLQSRDRIHRLGLNHNQYTRYYYLQSRAERASSRRAGFIDEHIYRRLKDKERIMYNAIDDKNLTIEYSRDEIIEAIAIIDDERKRMKKNNV